MKNKLFVFLFLSVVVCLLAGCNKPFLQTMGSNPMPVYHEPRWSGEQQKNFSVGADLFGTPYGMGQNVDEVHSVGGDIFAQYRFLDVFFVQAAFAGNGGSLKFDCNDDPCWNKYHKWMDSKEGEDSYSFWALQEQAMLGTDFKIGFFQFGFGGGIMLSQSNGDYEDKRMELAERGVIESPAEKNEIFPMVGIWYGFSLGKDGRYGLIKNETRMVFSDDLSDGGSLVSDVGSAMSMGLVYYHPSGFHGGLTVSTQQLFSIGLGKTFSF
jgi:hypothetical protein